MVLCSPTLEQFRDALSRDFEEPVHTSSTQRAAVAAVLRECSEWTELLFIRRAEHPLDPWSGHMAFPGGRVDPEDSTVLATAVRETREEIALDLEDSGRLLGKLSTVPVTARGRRLQMTIEPFVFELAADVPLVPNEEVDQVVWVPLKILTDPGRRETFTYTVSDAKYLLPCVRYQGNTIWGMTLGMADDLLSSVGAAPEFESSADP